MNKLKLFLLHKILCKFNLLSFLFNKISFSDDQDFYEATEFAHQSRDRYDTKLITIAMGPNIDVKKVGTLSYGEGFYFGADYPNLPSIAADVNKAICKSRIKGCGV